MNYKEFQPDGLLNTFVKCYWHFENLPDTPRYFTILPDGCFDLIISLNKNHQKIISLTGIWTKQVDVSIPGNTKLFGIRFTPLAAEYLLQQSIASLHNSKTEVKNNFWEIDKLSFVRIEPAVKKFDSILLSILSSGKGIDTRKQNLFQLLYHTNGGNSIEQYSNQVFWTKRQINRYFNEKLGLPLKSYCNILKCFASYRQISEGNFIPCQNYFDQSHFIKEIRKHTGQNPRQLHENKNDRFLQLATMKE